MNILGIDPCSSKNLGLCIYNTDKDSFHIVKCLKIESSSENVRLCNIFAQINEYLDDVQLLAIESSIGFGFAPTRSKIGENTGVIKLACYMRGIDVESINSRHAYSEIIGKYRKGEDKKRKTIDYIEKNYNLHINEHIADACLMALCASKEFTKR